MRHVLIRTVAIGSLAALSACGGGGGSSGADTTPPPAPPEGDYRVLAFNDLGMHCMDREYSIYAILPPYNVAHAQVIERGAPPRLRDDVSVSYQATPDPAGSVNSTSVAKTDFWQHANALFGVAL